MLVEARIRFRHRGCYSETLAPGVTVIHITGDSEHCLCAVKGPEGADLGPVVSSLAFWLDAPPRVLERTSRSLVVRCYCPRRGFAPLVGAWGASVLWPAVHKDGLEWWHLVAGSKEEMANVLRNLEEHGEVHVERMGNPTPDEIGVSLPLGELTSELSAKQLAILRHALARGYYASPRRVTLAQLAKEAGIARSTYQEHLAKAEERVLERFGGVLAEHPAVQAAAARRVGRPRKR